MFRVPKPPMNPGPNKSESLQERVLKDLVERHEVAVADLSANALTLTEEYTAAESIGAE